MIVAKTKETRCNPNYLHWSKKKNIYYREKNQKKEARMYKEHSERGTPKKNIYKGNIHILQSTRRGRHPSTILY